MSANRNVLKDKLKSLSPAQRASLLGKLGKRRNDADAQTGNAGDLAVVERHLSPMQRGLWLLDTLSDGDAAYNIPFAWKLEGALDHAAVRQSFDRIVERHEALRCVITRDSDDPRPVPLAATGADCRIVDLRSVGPDQDDVLHQLVEEESRRPFVLDRDPPFRAVIALLDSRRTALLTTFHHIAADGWSIGVFQQEFSVCYSAFASGQAPLLPPVPASYYDFTTRQHHRWQGEAGTAVTNQWLDELKGAPALIELPTDFPRPRVLGSRGGQRIRRLPGDVHQRVESLARRLGATPFMIYLACYQLTLARYGGLDDLVVGVPVANRDHPDVAGMIGFFSNAVPIRTQIHSDWSFADYLAKVKKSVLRALQVQDFPFELIVDAMGGKRDMSHSPIFQVSFNMLESEGATSDEFAGCTIESLLPDETSAKFDLELDLLSTSNGVRASFTFNRALYRESTVERLADRFEALTLRVLEESQSAIQTLWCVHAKERAELAHLGSGGECAQWKQCNFVHAFRRRAETDAARVALINGNAQTTYGELDALSSAAATRLVAAGVRPGDWVGIHLPRSRDFIVSVLGIFKAGAGYVPLDPAYPAARLAAIVEDSGLRVAVGQPISENTSDIDWLAPDVLLRSEGQTDTLPELTAHLPAYLMYTSGSTGRPKGVVVSQGSMMNHAFNAVDRYCLNAEDRVLHFSSPSFDISVEEVFPSLLSAATIVIYGPELELFAESFQSFVVDHAITVANLPTAYWHFWTGAGLTAKPLSDLRLVITGGEACRPDALARWFDHYDTEFVNSYGPTEATVIASAWRGSEMPAGQSVPIGRPLTNVELWVLDDAMQPVPRGTAGELYIGGAGVADGYWTLSRATADRFVPDPFGERPGGRLYRTGDRARWRDDGNLAFVGRQDSQVKILGHRVEPGEIEQHLMACDGVVGAVVLVAQSAAGEPVLNAYCAGDADVERIWEVLESTLPSYMRPSSIVTLEKLPLTKNGKVDRSALLEMEGSSTGRTISAMPSTQAQRRIAEIWCDILGVESPGLHEDFFRIGGHSLLATRAVARIRSAFNAEFSVRQFFESPTIAGQARALESAEGAHDQSISSVDPGPHGYRPSPAQKRLWFLSRLTGPSPTYNIPASMVMRGAVSESALRQAFEQVVERHQTLRSRFVEVDGEPFIVVDPVESFVIQRTDLRGLAPDAARRTLASIAADEAMRPFALEKEALFRVRFVTMADGCGLVLNMHHSVSDGRSMEILQREVGVLYRRYAPAPDALPLQIINTAELDDEVAAFWRAEGVAEPVQIPVDFPRPAQLADDVGIHAFDIPNEVAEVVARTATANNVSQDVVYLAAFACLVSRYSRAQEAAIGCRFGAAPMLPVRIPLPPDISFSQLLCRTGTAHSQVDKNHAVSLQQLTDLFQLESGTSPSLFQVAFDYSQSNAPMLPSGSDFSVNLIEKEREVHGILAFQTCLFVDHTAARMAFHYVRLLASLIAAPDSPITQAEMMDAAERETIASWSINPDTGRNYIEAPLADNLSEAFTQQVQRTPDRVAVIDGPHRLTYAELGRRVERLACGLVGAGISHGDLVGISLPRSLHQIVAIFAILRVGAAYVPLDPTAPADRLRSIGEDAGIRTCICFDDQAQRLGYESGGWLRPDAEGAPEKLTSSVSVAHADVAYMIYTSGSTGKPKGVRLTHGNALHFAAALLADLGLNPANEYRWAWNASISFDVSLEGLTQLLAGGTLCVLNDELRHDPQALFEFFETQRIDYFDGTPSQIEFILHHEASKDYAHALPHLIVAGEAIKPPLWQRIAQAAQAAGRRAYNGYGPTECTVLSSIAPIEHGRAPHIGKPLANTRCYVMDAVGNPCPVGVPGELWIGGSGVAQGYHERPDLTAEKFVSLRLGDESHRVYRSGDLVRWLPGGDIDYLERVDNQVKIRGYRIELGEIEAVLASQPGIRDVVVIVDGEGARSRLVAYVVPSEGERDGGAETQWRNAAASRLPEYMVPAQFVTLSAFPQNTSGKIDRKALPRPTAPRPEACDTSAATSSTERELMIVWSRLLGIKKLHPSDNFFALGGHSLLATRLQVAMRSGFRVHVPTSVLYGAADLHALAGYLDSAQTVDDGGPLEHVSRSPHGFEPSYVQERLWFLEQIEGGSVRFSLPLAVAYRAPVREDLLVQAVKLIVARHSALRSRFVDVDGSPWVEIDSAERFDVERLDLRTLDADRQKERVRQIVQDEIRREFHLEEGGLFRAITVQSSVGVALIVNMHHIISDGWSLNLLRDELAEIYQALHAGREPDLAELTVQYHDYAAWRRRYQSEERQQHLLDFWTARLGGAPRVLELPLDKPRPAQRGLAGNQVSVPVSSSVTRGLRQLARKSDATLFMVLLAAYQILLSRYTRQSDIVVGTPIASRPRAEIEPLIGFFADTLVLRSTIDDGATFDAFLADVREMVLQSYEHQDISFERLVEHLQPQRDASVYPLVQTFLSVHNEEPGRGLAIPGVVSERIATPLPAARNDLLVIVTDRGSELELCLEYDTDLFHESTVERLGFHLVHLLESIVQAPQRLVRKLNMAPESEWDSISAWSENRRALQRHAQRPVPTNIVEGFRSQVQRTPDREAVHGQTMSLSYRELDQWSDALAHHLQSLGAEAGGFIGICLERSPLQVVSILGILKCGCAYVPLDPSYPDQRLAYIEGDAGVRLVIGDQHHQSRLSVAADAWIDSSRLMEVSQSHPVPSRPQCAPDDVAYLIYTSGSTGNPKGVRNTHGNAVHFAYALQQRLDIPTDGAYRWAWNGSISFDASVEGWVQLLFGGTLCVLDGELRRDPDRLTAYFREQSIDYFDGTPSQIELLLEAGNIDGLPNLSIGGEAINPQLWNRIIDAVSQSGTRAYNVYGPTECTVATTIDLMERDRVPYLGRLLESAAGYVVDQHGNPVPIGVPGELLIGGHGVASGYHDRIELTAERFVNFQPPWGENRRVYRSGDLVRWLENGDLQFIGRIDAQVKIRGYRIELGEIEARLEAHEQVGKAAAVVRENGADKWLVAYVTASGGCDAPDAELLRSHLSQVLPEYMVPSAYVVLPSIPINTSGKVDVHALPSVRFDNERTTGALHGQTEETLADIWRELLQRADIDRQSNFFDLGGHSLLVARMVAMISTRLSADIALVDVFRDPVLRSLAQKVDAAQETAVVQEIPAATPDEKGFLLSPTQQRLWFIEQMMGPSTTYSVPLPLLIRSEIDVRALRRAFEELVNRHDALRSRIVEYEGEPRVIVGDKERFAVQSVDLRLLSSDMQESTVRQMAQDDATRAFDLASGNLFRVTFVQLSNALGVLMNAHHIISDGMSIDIIQQEVSDLYASFLQGSVPKLDTPVQYQDYAHWQRQRLDGPRMQELREYWRQQMHGAPPQLQLPTDFPRPERLGSRGGRHRELLPASLSAQVRRLCKSTQTTAFMLFMAAYQSLLSRCSRQHDIVVGTPIANRPHEDLQKVVGFFADTMVIRGQPVQDLSFRQFLRQIKEVTLSGFAHQDLGFDQLVELLKQPRSLAFSPVFQTMLSVTARAASEAESTLDIEALDATTPVAKFDLMVGIAEREEQFAMNWEYNEELFSRESIVALASWFRRLLSSLCAAPDRLLGDHVPELDEWRDRWIARAQASLDANTPALPALQCQYQDYAAWQLSRAADGHLDRLYAYWEQQLKGAPDVLELPTDFARPATLGVRGGDISLTIPSSVAQGIRQICQRSGCTMFMATLAAWQVVLARFAQQDDVLVGTPVANRPTEELNDLIGFFANTLVIRSSVDGQQTFDAHLGSVRRTVIDAFAHEDLGFDQLVEKLNPTRSLSHSPLFQTLFTMTRDTAEPESSVAGLQVDPVPVDMDIAKFDLSLNVVEGLDSLRVHLEYHRDLFCHSTANQILEQFGRVLDRLAVSENATIASLCEADDTDRQKLTAWGIGKRTAIPSDCDFASAFVSQVQSSPDLPAVRENDQVWTYSELDSLANGFAWQLTHAGISRGDRVGIALQRGADQVMVMLGILKLGAVMVPIDPTAPAERVGWQLADAKVSWVVCDPTIAMQLEIPADRRIEPTRSERKAPPDTAELTAEAEAYVLYTSGSTGRPKGVRISHGNIVSFAHALQSALGWERSEPLCWGWNASLTFDVAMEGFTQLLFGGQLCIIADVERKDPQRFYSLLERVHIDYFDATPTQIEMILAGGREDQHALLPNLVIAGEAISHDLWQRLVNLSQREGIAIYNGYGPTEATVLATISRVESETRPNIGRPLANTICVVLDEYGRPVAPGVPGELCLGGQGISAGYLNQPRLNEERFCNLALPDGTRQRLYRTGDQVRWLADGALQYLGRRDGQVKLRGYRIELGEIEAALARIDGVAAAAATIQGADETRQLVGYVVATPGSDPLEEDRVRAQVARMVPEYMVPTRVVNLKELPCNASGKLDRRALPAPPPGSQSSESASVRTATEARVRDVWQELLGSTVTGDTNFFAAGGHSFLAVVLIRRLNDAFASDLSVSDLFRAPTVSSLSALLDAGNNHARQTGDQDTSAAPKSLFNLVDGDPGREPLILIHPIGGTTLCYRELAQSFSGDRTVLGIEIGTDAANFRDASMDELAARYANEILRTQDRTRVWLGGWSMGGVIAHFVARRLRQHGVEVCGIVMIDSHLPGAAYSRAELTDADLIRHLARELGVSSRRSTLDISTLLELARISGVLPFDARPSDIKNTLAIHRRNADLLADARVEPDNIPVLYFAAGAKDARGWQDIYPELTCKTLKCDHFGWRETRHVRHIHRDMQNFMKQTKRRQVAHSANGGTRSEL